MKLTSYVLIEYIIWPENIWFFIIYFIHRGHRTSTIDLNYLFFIYIEFINIYSLSDGYVFRTIILRSILFM